MALVRLRVTVHTYTIDGINQINIFVRSMFAFNNNANIAGILRRLNAKLTLSPSLLFFHYRIHHYFARESLFRFLFYHIHEDLYACEEQVKQYAQVNYYVLDGS